MTETSLPVLCPLLPTDRIIAPPRPPDEEPLLIVTSPAAAALSPLNKAKSPEEEGVPLEVVLVAPVATVTSPDKVLPATESADFIVTEPVTLVSDAPPVTVIAPPFKFVEPPADKAMVLPAPLVLLPTVMLIAPPWAALEEPLVIDT